MLRRRHERDILHIVNEATHWEGKREVERGDVEKKKNSTTKYILTKLFTVRTMVNRLKRRKENFFRKTDKTKANETSKNFFLHNCFITTM